MDQARVVGYARCSTTEQAVDGLSLPAQRAQIARWCDLVGADLVEVIEDAGVSGGKRLADRPAGSRIALLLASRRPTVETVVIARLDRLGRDAAETLAHLRRFRQGQLGLVSIADRLDLSTPQGRAMAQMSAVFSELERGLIGQRTSDALRELRHRGAVYGPLPYGFQALDGNLILDSAEQSVLRTIQDLRTSGQSYAAIAQCLTTRGIPAKRGGPWHAMSVRSVLRTQAGLQAPETQRRMKLDQGVSNY